VNNAEKSSLIFKRHDVTDFLKTSGSDNAVTIRHVPDKKAIQVHHHSMLQRSMIVHIIGGHTAAVNSFALYRHRQIR
jgi:hypothetical protein